MMGHPVDRPPDRRRPSPTTPLRRRPDGKTHYVRVSGEFGADGRYHVRSVGGAGQPPAGGHGARRTALAVVPDGDGVAEGGPCDRPSCCR